MVIILAGAALVGLFVLGTIAVGAVLLLGRHSSAQTGFRPAPPASPPSPAPQAPTPTANPGQPAGPSSPPGAAPSPPDVSPMPAPPLSPAPSAPSPPAGTAPTPPMPQASPSPPGAPAEPSGPVAMQRYTAPSGQWGIDYPQGWQTQDQGAGVVVFYRDDPAEGTSFWIAGQSVGGEVDVRQIAAAIVQKVRQEYPDLQVRVAGVREMSQGGASGQILDGDASWTGHSQQAMRSVLRVLRFSQPGATATGFVFMNGQSPAVAFETVRPVYLRMMDSVRSGTQ